MLVMLVLLVLLVYLVVLQLLCSREAKYTVHHKLSFDSVSINTNVGFLKKMKALFFLTLFSVMFALSLLCPSASLHALVCGRIYIQMLYITLRHLLCSTFAHRVDFTLCFWFKHIHEANRQNVVSFFVIPYYTSIFTHISIHTPTLILLYQYLLSTICMLIVLSMQMFAILRRMHCIHTYFRHQFNCTKSSFSAIRYAAIYSIYACRGP